jgi:hypothetical protein
MEYVTVYSSALLKMYVKDVITPGPHRIKILKMKNIVRILLCTLKNDLLVCEKFTHVTKCLLHVHPPVVGQNNCQKIKTYIPLFCLSLKLYSFVTASFIVIMSIIWLRHETYEMYNLSNFPPLRVHYGQKISKHR